MKQWLSNIFFLSWLGLTIGLVFLCFLNRCKDQPAPIHTVEKTVINNYYDSSTKQLPAAPVVLERTYTVSFPSIVDTLEILKRYFSISTYSSQTLDSNIRVKIFDTISQNRIYGRRVEYNWLRPVKTVESTTISTVEDNHGIFIGAFAQGKQGYFGMGPQISWLTKKNVILNYQFDVFNKSHQLGTQFKINGRTKR